MPNDPDFDLKYKDVMTNYLNFASVTKKITLAIVGGFLMIFLLLHAGINLCMLRSDGGEWFRAAAHFMGTNVIIKIFEYVLFAAFIAHILLALWLQIENWRARGPVGYKVPGKAATRPGSRFMIYTGILVFIFLAIHMMNFYFVKKGWVEGRYMVELKDVDQIDQATLEANQMKIVPLFQSDDPELANEYGIKEIADNLTKEQLDLFGENFTAYEPDFFNMAKELFANRAYSTIYLILIVVLAIHLRHAFGSAFQTLGWNHPKYTPFIEKFGLFYAVLIGVMFGIIPVWMMLGL